MRYRSDKWDKYDDWTSSNAPMNDIMRYLAAAKEAESNVTVDDKTKYEQRIEDLQDAIASYKQELEEALIEKKSAQRKLKIFLKAVTKFVSLDKLKIEVKELIRREKDRIKIAKFFGGQTNQLEEFEDSLDEFPD